MNRDPIFPPYISRLVDGRTLSTRAPWPWPWRLARLSMARLGGGSGRRLRATSERAPSPMQQTVPRPPYRGRHRAVTTGMRSDAPPDGHGGNGQIRRHTRQPVGALRHCYYVLKTHGAVETQIYYHSAGVRSHPQLAHTSILSPYLRMQLTQPLEGRCS